MTNALELKHLKHFKCFYFNITLAPLWVKKSLKGPVGDLIET